MIQGKDVLDPLALGMHSMDLNSWSYPGFPFAPGMSGYFETKLFRDRPRDIITFGGIWDRGNNMTDIITKSSDI